jgi:glycosyltransferase involved in cell wall biosynthesis
MRVAYVCADPGIPVFGRKGSSIHVREVVRALGRQGVHVELFSPRLLDPPPQGLDGVRLHPLPPPAQGRAAERERACLEANAQLRASIEGEGPFDMVYERYSLWSFQGMEYARDHGIPGLLEVNSPLIEEQAEHRTLVDRRIAEEVATRVYSSCTAILAVSADLAAHLERHPAARGRIHLVPNGVDPSRFPEGVRPSHPAPEGTFTVGFVGNLKPWHGLQDLVEGFSLLHSRRPTTRLMVVGDGPERRRLEADVASHGLREVAMVGEVEHDEMPGLLASMDVGVAPHPALPNFYFSPLKVFEYMAAGLPVVASRVGQLAQVVEDGVQGVLFPPGDTTSLALALERLMDDPVGRARMGSAGRTTVRLRYTWDGVARRILSFAPPGMVLETRPEVGS